VGSSGRRAWTRAAAIIAAIVVAALGAAYYLTYEPAPQITIVWRDDDGPAARRPIERRHKLIPTLEDQRRVVYDLLDTRPSNIRPLLEHPDVEDAIGIDRRSYSVRPDVPYGTRWMWIGNRLPVLRTLFFYVSFRRSSRT
jgi:hypothetical protein